MPHSPGCPSAGCAEQTGLYMLILPPLFRVLRLWVPAWLGRLAFRVLGPWRLPFSAVFLGTGLLLLPLLTGSPHPVMLGLCKSCGLPQWKSVSVQKDQAVTSLQPHDGQGAAACLMCRLPASEPSIPQPVLGMALPCMCAVELTFLLAYLCFLQDRAHLMFFVLSLFNYF